MNVLSPAARAPHPRLPRYRDGCSRLLRSRLSSVVALPSWLGSGSSHFWATKAKPTPCVSRSRNPSVVRRLIMPRPGECIRSILHILDAAYELLHHRRTVSLVDGYRRALAEPGRSDKPHARCPYRDVTA
jgi:hypothetical protein